jgi:hypothetical protein
MDELGQTLDQPALHHVLLVLGCNRYAADRFHERLSDAKEKTVNIIQTPLKGSVRMKQCSGSVFRKLCGRLRADGDWLGRSV